MYCLILWLVIQRCQIMRPRLSIFNSILLRFLRRNFFLGPGNFVLTKFDDITNRPRLRFREIYMYMYNLSALVLQCKKYISPFFRFRFSLWTVINWARLDNCRRTRSKIEIDPQQGRAILPPFLPLRYLCHPTSHAPIYTTLSQWCIFVNNVSV